MEPHVVMPTLANIMEPLHQRLGEAISNVETPVEAMKASRNVVIQTDISAGSAVTKTSASTPSMLTEHHNLKKQ
eukprot:6338532-Amphidinium_carterae.3